MRTFALFCILSLTISSPAAAKSSCKPVTGHFEAHVVIPGTGHCPADTSFCTAGRVWGGIQGDYQFVMSGLIPSSTIGGTPTIFFFTGRSDIALGDGSSVVGTDTGTIDLPPGAGGFASLITFTTGATGQIRLRGEFSAASGTTAGDYTGTLCRP